MSFVEGIGTMGMIGSETRAENSHDALVGDIRQLNRECSHAARPGNARVLYLPAVR